MDSPENDIEVVIKTLCQGSAREQDEALNKYFLPDASFTHPLCYVPRFRGVWLPFVGNMDSLWFVQCIYRWYITFAPSLNIVVDSTAFDEKNGLLYATIRQHFRIWFFPIYSITVKLVTVLKLEKQHSRLASDGNQGTAVDANANANAGGADGESINGASMLRYYIASQEDMYQMNYCLEFCAPHVAARLWTLVQLFITSVCVVLSVMTLPLHFYLNPDTKRQKSKQ